VGRTETDNGQVRRPRSLRTRWSGAWPSWWPAGSCQRLAVAAGLGRHAESSLLLRVGVGRSSLAAEAGPVSGGLSALLEGKDPIEGARQGARQGRSPAW